jgi:hypothetical protein
MMASGPLAPSLPRHRSGGYVRSGRPRVRHRADIHRQGHLAAPERRASSPLRACVRDKRARRVLQDIRLQKPFALQFFQRSTPDLPSFAPMIITIVSTTLDSAACPWIHADQRSRSIDDSSDSPVKTAVTVPFLRCAGALEQVFFH